MKSFLKEWWDIIAVASGVLLIIVLVGFFGTGINGFLMNNGFAHPESECGKDKKDAPNDIFYLIM